MSPDHRLRVFMYAEFDLEALYRQASSLRQGVSCTCDADQRPASGSYNWAIFISFEDGIRWVFRTPHTRYFTPMETGMKLLAIEVATLRYLRVHGDVPVPEVSGYCDSSDNDIGLPYILMSEARGWPLSKVWRSSGFSELDLDLKSKAKVLSQLGLVTWRLSRLRFDKIGSLFEEKDGKTHVGECLSRGHMSHGRCELEQVPRGPFASEIEFHDSLVVSAFFGHGQTCTLRHHCFMAPVPSEDVYESRTKYMSAVDLWNDFATVGRKIDSAVNRLDYTIADDALRDIIRRVGPATVHPGSFPLCHPDLSVNNIYVDDDCNITCIIGCAFASSVPESMLFTPPGLPQWRDQISPELDNAFKYGFLGTVLASDEKILIDRYRESLERSSFFWSLTQLLSLDCIADSDLFAAVWDVGYGSEKDLRQHFLEQRRLPHYTELYSEMQEGDRPQWKVHRDEQDYFRRYPLQETIARKLTLVSEWKTQHTEPNAPRLRNDVFVADAKLWRWIVRWMEEMMGSPRHGRR